MSVIFGKQVVSKKNKKSRKKNFEIKKKIKFKIWNTAHFSTRADEYFSGVRGFYKGFTVACVSHVPQSTIFWTTYGLVKQKVKRRNINNTFQVIIAAALSSITGLDLRKNPFFRKRWFIAQIWFLKRNIFSK